MFFHARLSGRFSTIGRARAPKPPDEGFTLIELLVVVAVIAIIAAIAVPALLRARTASNETAAIAGLRAINTAQTGFSAACGQGWYADALPTLGVPPPGGNQAFLASELTLGLAPAKSGFVYALAVGAGGSAGPAACNGNPSTSAYYAKSEPIAPSASGNRGFATNAGGAIWQNVAAGAAAPIEPFTPSATVSPIQ